jgi:hypothetical protein
MKSEYLDKFLLRVIPIYNIFCESDKPFRFEFFTRCSYLFYFPKEEEALMSNEQHPSYQEYPPLECLI